MSSKQQRQKPDSTLQGVEYVGARVIADREPRAFGARYDAKFFSGIFEISADLLSSEKYRTALEIDLAEPQESSIVPINASDKSQIIRQEIFKDAIPWIVVTLYDMWNPWFRETLAADKLSEKAQKQKSQPSSSAFRSRLF